jgi:hypothetical protein
VSKALPKKSFLIDFNGDYGLMVPGFGYHPIAAHMLTWALDRIHTGLIFNKPLDVMLCGDCLRVEFWHVEKHNSVIPCACGGDFCGCSGCSEVAHKLLSGCRDPDGLNLENIRPGFLWCMETGTGV